jgi:hypothetical protein
VTRLQPGDHHYGVHMNHCNEGECFRICKYGEPDICPALEGMLPDPDPETVVKALTWMAEQMERQNPEYTNNIYRQAIILIDYHGHYHEY